MAQNIHFFCDDVEYRLRDKRKIRNWILKVVQAESYTITSLNVVFCSDNQLLNINKTHLNHNYFTDIITFQYSDGNEIEGEIFISMDRVRDNAKNLSSGFINELHRVIIHGVLHLCGYSDKSEEEKALMRQKEDSSLALRDF